MHSQPCSVQALLTLATELLVRNFVSTDMHILIDYTEEVLNEARAIAGPKDARTMVGKDFGGLRVMNQTPLPSS